MAADTKGLLTYLEGTSLPLRIINFVVSSFVFVFLSEKVANATGKLTDLLCGKAPKTLKAPRMVKEPTPEPQSRGTYVSLPMKDEGPSAAVNEKPDFKTHSRQSSQQIPVAQKLLSDGRIRFAGILLTLWILNWIYPTDPPPQGHLVGVFF